MSTVIVLSGPVGAGKTTVARALRARWLRPLSFIEGDRFWDFAPEGPGLTGQARRKAGFPVIMRAMLAAARAFARSGHDVLLDFSIPPVFLETARKILKDVPLRYIVLLPDLQTCAARAAARSEGAIADYTGYAPFHALFARAAAHAIDNRDTDPEALAAYLRSALEDGQFRVD